MQRHLESQEVSYQPWKRSRWCGTENPEEILKEGVSHEQDLKLFWVSWIVFIEGLVFQATQKFGSQVCTTSTSWQLFFAWWRSWYGSEDLKALFQELWIDLISQAPKACATSTSWQGRPSTTNNWAGDQLDSDWLWFATIESDRVTGPQRKQIRKNTTSLKLSLKFNYR